MKPSKKALREARPKPCEHCESEKVLLRRTVSASGINMYFWLCAECQDHARKTNQWIGHAVIMYWIESGHLDVKAPEGIPIFASYQDETRCEVCDRAGAEWHHWAPQSMADLFGEDWTNWPGSYLCVEHHRQWHEIVTPQLVKGASNGQRKDREPTPT